MEKHDIAIIGNGPAGVSAALTAKVRHCDFIFIGSEKMSKKLSLTQKIENYPGEFEISGERLLEKYKDQLEKMGIETLYARVSNVYPMGQSFMILTDKGDIEAKSLILATGAASGKLIKGEDVFLGKGVSYCATCDGNLYRNKRIAVICDDDNLEEDVDYLASLVSELYYFPTFTTELNKENIKISSSKVKEICGDKLVDSIVLDDDSKINVDGVFVLRTVIAADSLVYGLKSENGNVVVDKNMATNIAGLFACGDITGRPYQITKAEGEGNVAIHSAISYLNSKK